MPYCPNCGTEVTSTSKFCPSCGAPLSMNAETSVVPSTGTLTLYRVPSDYYADKRIIISIDNEPYGEVMPGMTINFTVPVGNHVVGFQVQDAEYYEDDITIYKGGAPTFRQICANYKGSIDYISGDVSMDVASGASSRNVINTRNTPVQATRSPAPARSHKKGCPNCGSDNWNVQVFQEDHGSIETTTVKYVTKEARHGILWWLFIGWWWWPIKLCLWIFYFPIMLILRLFKRKKYVTTGGSTTITKNNITYNKKCVCHDCGYMWNS